jgi:hypothetical protein
VRVGSRGERGAPVAALGVIGALGLLGVLAALAWGELEHWLASRRGFGPAPTDEGLLAVVVLGYGDRGPRANFVNRYRVRAALRTVDAARGAPTVLVVCGGPVHSAIPEADLLADHARELGYRGPIRYDRESRTTFENIDDAVPLVEDAVRIAVVSNSLHAERARARLRAVRPDLGARLVRAEEHRFGELTLVKPWAAYRDLRLRAEQRGRR